MSPRVGMAVLAGVLIAAAAIPADHLVVTGEAGERLWTLPLPPGSSIVLAYENSIYRAATEEVLSSTADGFTLTAVRSTSQGVLAYNGLAAPFTRQGPWYIVTISRPLPVLIVRIGRTGRQHLILGERVVPLYEAGEGTRVSVDVEHAPRLLAVFRAWALH